MMWKESYRIGIESIDLQHMELFNMVENLLEIIRAEKSDIQQECNRAIDFLKDYVVRHFEDEEAYLESVNYPDIEAHKLIHKGFVNTVLSYEKKMKESGYDMADVKQFSGMLTTWLIYHVAGEDRRYIQTEKIDSVPHSKTYEESFERSMKSVFGTLTGVAIDEVVRDQKIVGEEERLYVNVGLKGGYTGQATFTYPKETAFSIIENMTSMEVSEVDDLVISALCEMANIVSGNAASELAASGIECDITPPHFQSDDQLSEKKDYIQFATKLGEVGVRIDIQ